MEMLTQSQVLAKMDRDDAFAVNLLLALYGQQTADEQQMQGTKHDNGAGFNGCDAGILSSFAEQAKQTRKARKAGTCHYSTDLSVKQLALLRKKLVKYGRQLSDLTNAQMAAKVAIIPPQDEVHIILDDSPYGTLPATKFHPLPDYLIQKVVDKNRLREAETQSLTLGPTDLEVQDGGADFEFSGALVPVYDPDLNEWLRGLAAERGITLGLFARSILEDAYLRWPNNQ